MTVALLFVDIINENILKNISNLTAGSLRSSPKYAVQAPFNAEVLPLRKEALKLF